MDEQNRSRRSIGPAADDDPTLLNDDYTNPDPVANMVDSNRDDVDDGDAAILAQARRDLRRTIGRREEEPATPDAE